MESQGGWRLDVTSAVVALRRTYSTEQNQSCTQRLQELQISRQDIQIHAKTTKMLDQTPKQLNYSLYKDLRSLTLWAPLELCEQSHENIQKELTKFSNFCE